jgi:REP element-mobilizing transposase RayT
MREPLAYFLTWTCYGTWLHGDARGSVAPGWNSPGTETIAPHPRREQFEARRMTSPPFELGPAARQVVNRVLADHAAQRDWELLAVNVRSNHVHAIVRPAGLKPERMLAEFKAWSTRRLREQGHAAPDATLWTRHGSTRYLWTPANVEAAVVYVVEGQDSRR